MRANAAIFYHRDGYDTAREHLMGRHAAGESFLRGFLRHAGTDRVYCHAPRPDFDHFLASVQPLLRDGQAVEWIPPASLGRLGEPGCLYLPTPGLVEPAWSRRIVGQRAYSLCGVTHTVASGRIMDLVGQLLVAPVQPWDAIICTSRAVRQAVGAMAEGWSAYLARRLGARPTLAVQLPVIPLGVECERFAPSSARQAARAGLRRRFGIGEADVAFLFMGRLSFHAKANPLPMYQGLEEAARRTGARLHLILSGWFANADIERAFRAGAAQYAPSVGLVVVDGRTPEMRADIWSAADAFTSLSDNIQESFGLTPVEAMAAGLPAVVSDWDGYRDTVRHGIEGFAVPTTAPPPGAGEGLATRYALEIDSYDRYIGHASQFTAVDIDAAATAYERLVREPGLRRAMGEAGRRRAREVFDWSVVIAAYQELWAELARIRQAPGGETAPPAAEAPLLPQRPDPFSAFRGFPSAALAGGSRLSLRGADAAGRLAGLLAHPLTALSRPLLLPEEECRAVLDLIGRLGAPTVTELMQRLPGHAPPPRLALTLCWMAKGGLVRIDPGLSPGEPAPPPA